MEPFPQEIARFVEANIESVDQLEILRVLAANPETAWNVAALAREIHGRPELIALHLNSLDGRGLLTVSRTAEVSYRYGATTPELQEKVHRLLKSYNERPVTMIKLVYARLNNILKSTPTDRARRDP